MKEILSSQTEIYRFLRSTPRPVWIEILTVITGIRPVAKFCLPEDEAEKWRCFAAEVGLYCHLSQYSLVPAGKAGVGNYLMKKAKNSKPGGFRDIVIAKTESEAECLFDLNQDSQGDELQGLYLGYPECCVSAYQNLLQEKDWVKQILEATPVQLEFLPAVSNRLCRLFQATTFLPDYFPCKLNCEASGQFAKRIIKMLLSLGLSELATQSIKELCRPILITPFGYFQLPYDWQMGVVFSIYKMEIHSFKDEKMPTFNHIYLCNNQIILSYRGREVFKETRDASSTRLLQFYAPEIDDES